MYFILGSKRVGRTRTHIRHVQLRLSTYLGNDEYVEILKSCVSGMKKRNIVFVEPEA